jgi:predicted dehydrogenase
VYAHDIETEDYTAALLEMQNGKPALISTTTCYHIGDECGVYVCGSKGSVTDMGGELRVKFEDGQTELTTPIPDWPKSAAQDMVRVLQKGDDPFLPGEEGIRSIIHLEAMYKKAGIL